MIDNILETEQHILEESNLTTSDYDDAPFDTNILDLDDDSLSHILQFISLRDKLSFLSAHDRFSSAFQIHAKIYIKEITEYDVQHLEPFEICNYFKIAGEYLETLTLLADFEKYSGPTGFGLVKLCCPNLKRLSLWGHRNETLEHFEKFRELLLNKPNLRTLRLQRLRLKDAYFDLMLEAELPKLEHLSIVHCQEFTGCSLEKFTNLKKLRLENLGNLNHSVIQSAFSVMQNLYALSYLEADIPDELSAHFVEVFNNLHLYNKKLEILELNMHNTRNVRVSRLPKLKHFTYGLRDNNRLTTLEMSELADKKKNELESLRIVSFWDFRFNVWQCELISQFVNLKKLHLPWKDLSKHGININDDSLRHLCALKNLVEFKACGENKFTKDGLIDLIRNCRKLKWVNIQCSLIGNQFARELIPVILTEGKRPNGRITFLAYGSRMKKSDFPEIYDSDDVKQAVEFIFEDLFTLETYDNFYDDFEHDCNFVRTPFCAYS